MKEKFEIPTRATNSKMSKSDKFKGPKTIKVKPFIEVSITNSKYTNDIASKA